ncbi:KH domain-containing protein [Nosema bombycis CQ1]|uniref:KH domain-containing protein n=1 Tax=Nosema bombycis (strain CQ1 / CVCC 102059) TaxID=578461 RepID=R0KV80_NOSB1|nr:KH domain-containing protein [Nosema bombycis CQ1]|eukprot:EOB14132.1 KH domain-containing protein [Nosema bombycis CQ1]
MCSVINIRDSFRYVYEIEIPLCLYSQKHLFYANCVNIMHKHKCIIYVQITNKIKFFIGGRSKDVNNCRLEILKEIEDFLGNKSEIIKGEYDLVRLIKEERKRVFVGSFIDSNRMVVSYDEGMSGDVSGGSKGGYLTQNPLNLNHNPLNHTPFNLNHNPLNLTPLTHIPTLNQPLNPLTHNHHFLEMIHLDPLKYTWILLYKRYELDNILIKFSTYLNVIESSPKITKLMFMSLSKINLKNALISFNEIYNLILIVNFSDLIYQKIEKVIIFEDRGVSTVVGEIQDIKEIMSLKVRKNCRGEDKDYKSVDKIDGFIKPNPYHHNSHHSHLPSHNPPSHNSLNDLFEAFIDIDSDTLDFMCGKKNGKIIKIMKGLGCTIEVIRRSGFEKSHVYIKGKKSVFSIALSMIYSEFPSHINFNIDSKYHKGIIGYGGKTIQKMMKKHGVYIKFMSLMEMNQEGFEFNVLIKTPKKNESNLLKMKNELFEVIEEKQEEEKEYKEINYEEFYYENHKQSFLILFDKFLIKEKGIEKVYYYIIKNEKVDEGSDVDQKNINFSVIMKNGDKFIKSHLKLKDKPITVGHWLIVVPEESRNLYVLTISGMRIIYKIFEEQNEICIDVFE